MKKTSNKKTDIYNDMPKVILDDLWVIAHLGSLEELSKNDLAISYGQMLLSAWGTQNADHVENTLKYMIGALRASITELVDTVGARYPIKNPLDPAFSSNAEAIRRDFSVYHRSARHLAMATYCVNILSSFASGNSLRS